jgi:hypothetical protein
MNSQETQPETQSETLPEALDSIMERQRTTEARLNELVAGLDKVQATLIISAKAHLWRQFAFSAMTNPHNEYIETVTSIADQMLEEYLKRFPLEVK